MLLILIPESVEKATKVISEPKQIGFQNLDLGDVVVEWAQKEKEKMSKKFCLLQ